MKSTVVKRSIVLAGHKTTVSLVDAFGEGLKDIAKTKRKTLSELVSGIDIDREHANLSSAIRLFVSTTIKREQHGASRVDEGPAEASGKLGEPASIREQSELSA